MAELRYPFIFYGYLCHKYPNRSKKVANAYQVKQLYGGIDDDYKEEYDDITIITVMAVSLLRGFWRPF